VSGDLAVTHPRARLALHCRFLADAADMESAAVGERAQRAGLPFLAVRCVSDLAGADALAQFRLHLPMAAGHAALAALGALAWAERRR
jgi:adenosylhomocysteine nucleosidase